MSATSFSVMSFSQPSLAMSMSMAQPSLAAMSTTSFDTLSITMAS